MTTRTSLARLSSVFARSSIHLILRLAAESAPGANPVSFPSSVTLTQYLPVPLRFSATLWTPSSVLRRAQARSAKAACCLLLKYAPTCRSPHVTLLAKKVAMPTNESDVIQYPAMRPIRLRNINCVYCGGLFGADRLPTKEHVVGRRFVPRGCFDGQWNLIANACGKCNGDKADLEDDISAISMLPDAAGRYASDDPRLEAEAKRKSASAHSRRSGKAVAQSEEQMQLTQISGDATFTFTFTAPPQVDEKKCLGWRTIIFAPFFPDHLFRNNSERWLHPRWILPPCHDALGRLGQSANEMVHEPRS